MVLLSQEVILPHHKKALMHIIMLGIKKKNIHKIIYFLAIVGALIGQGQEQTVGLFLNTPAAAPGYTLFAPMSYNVTYLIDNNGELVQSWSSEYRPGLSVYILENGDLLRTRIIQGQLFQTGGHGGGVEIIDWDGNLVWEFDYFSDQYWQHHDIESLPNGNVLLIAWEHKADATAIANGRNPNMLAGSQQPFGFWPDHIIEVNPESNSIAWEWHVWDHLIQDYDSSKVNYGVVSDHPELVNLNYPSGPNTSGDWLHINAVDYNAELDQIILSVHHFGEIWIIDHSTTTIEAASHTGGNSGKGGDLLYRWGNPQAYIGGNSNERIFFGQHDARWIEDGSQIMVFNNGSGRPGGSYSSIDVITQPIGEDNLYVLDSNGIYGPDTLSWQYTATPLGDLFAANISGAHRLENGNTLICDGPRGHYFEVDSAGSLVWDYVNPVVNTGPLYQGQEIPTQGSAQNSTLNRTFRVHRYPTDYLGFAGHNLEPTGPIELYMNTHDLTYLPDKHSLHQNYPNPLNPETIIPYDLPENIFVNITIYDLLGRQVKTLVNQVQNAGFNSIQWNATNDYGEPVSAGIYLYQIQAGTFYQTRKMALLR